MFGQRLVSIAAIALLASCSGGGDGAVSGTGSGTGSSPTPTPSPVAAGCTLRERQDWVSAQMREWYLFPETLPASLDPSGYTTLESYVDALTATARSQRRDRYFTYVTSIAEENAYYSSGSSAGLGVRLGMDMSGRRLFVAESFEGAPALAAGIDRGTEILSIGTTTGNLRTVDSIAATGGYDALTTALGPDTAGTTRVLRVTDSAGTRNVTVTKADFTITPVSSRYGGIVIEDNGHRVGYLNLRTFISTADDVLRSKIADFRARGVTEIIVDLRYNGGGLVSTAEVLADLLGGNRATIDVVDYLTYRPEKSAENERRTFSPQPQSVAPLKIAFIGTGGTASASELIINAFTPYLHGNAALIGTNTYGKPVGQIALDRDACDDRLRVIAFSVKNAARNANYFNGLAGSVEASCQADDDITHKFGDPQEASIRRSLDYLEGKSCTPISTAATTASASSSGKRVLMTPAMPNTAQREVPGLF